jgi:hypothetical protein
MITVAEHTYEETLLPERANILDLGCRGFLFSGKLKQMGHEVYPVDIDYLGPEGYFQVGIGGSIGRCSIKKGNDPQATQKVQGHDVLMLTIDRFSRDVKVDFWDLIKIDIEGSEYEVIMSLTEPPAKQLSIEFHLHTKVYGDKEVKEMEDKLVSLGYYPAKHDKTSEHGCGLNYWDSLWILK